MVESNCGLHNAFGELAARIPDGPPGEAHFIFHGGTLPVPPASLTTDRLLIRKVNKTYNTWYRADALWLYLTPETSRELGAYLLAACFHGPPERTTLAITHKDSEIRQIVIAASQLSLDDPPVGLSMVPFALRYYPQETATFPWMYKTDTRDLPVFALSNADDCVGPTDEDWSKRDTIWMYPDPGTILFAELLLNAGCSWNETLEYALEGEASFRGVGRMSAELRIFLPGSFGWLFPTDDALGRL